MNGFGEQKALQGLHRHLTLSPPPPAPHSAAVKVIDNKEASVNKQWPFHLHCLLIPAANPSVFQVFLVF